MVVEVVAAAALWPLQPSLPSIAISGGLFVLARLLVVNVRLTM